MIQLSCKNLAKLLVPEKPTILCNIIPMHLCYKVGRTTGCGFFTVNSVDLTQCGFRTVENILTWMSCRTQCFMIGGVQDIYNPGPSGFQIYPHVSRTETLTVEHMKNTEAQVHYQVTGEC